MQTALYSEEMASYVEWLCQQTQYPIQYCKALFLERFPECERAFEELIWEWLD